MKNIQHYNDGVILLLLLSLAFFTAFCMHPLVIIMSFLGASALMLSYKSFSKFLLKLFNCFIFILLFAVINPLISHKGVNILFYLNGNPYTAEAFIYGVFCAMMLSAIFIWFENINNILSPDSIICVSGRYFPKLSLVLSMSLKTLSMYVSNAKEIAECSKTMGLSGTDPISKFKSTVRVFSILITTIPEDIIETSIMMNARGFGAGKYKSFSKNKLKRRDIILISIYVFLFISLFFFDLKAYRYYPFFEISLPDFILFVTLFFIMFLPSIIWVKESIIWHYLKSAI